MGDGLLILNTSLPRPLMTTCGMSLLSARSISLDSTGTCNDTLKVHKIEIFFGFDFEICIISLLVM